MGLDRPLDDSQPEPASAGPTRDEGVEEPVADLLRYAGTGVAHLKTNRVIDVGPVRDVASLHRSYTDDDSDRSAGGLHGVQHQIGDHAVQQVLVTLENRSTSLDRDGRVGPAVGVSLDETHDRDDDRVYIERDELGGTDPGKVQELAQQTAQPIALPNDEPGQKAFVFIGVLGSGQLLDRAANGGEGVSDLVRQ